MPLAQMTSGSVGGKAGRQRLDRLAHRLCGHDEERAAGGPKLVLAGRHPDAAMQGDVGKITSVAAALLHFPGAFRIAHPQDDVAPGRGGGLRERRAPGSPADDGDRMVGHVTSGLAMRWQACR